jgi:hypothetical protein
MSKTKFDIFLGEQPRDPGLQSDWAPWDHYSPDDHRPSLDNRPCLFIRGKNHGPRGARLDVRAMTAFLANEAEARREKHGFERAPMLGREPRHGASYTTARQLCCSTPIQSGPRQDSPSRV